MKKFLSLIAGYLIFCQTLFAHDLPTPIDSRVNIVGGGIVGSLEAYYAFKDAEKDGKKIAVTVFEKCTSFDSSRDGGPSTNTSYNIVPSLTVDEILSVVPRGVELVEKLGIAFCDAGGIRTDDVAGVNDSPAATNFIKSVAVYGSDQNHEDRTNTLLNLGKKSMDLWQQLYDEADSELKEILISSYFNPCHEPVNSTQKVLKDGYRIDLIYGYAGAPQKALKMKADYEKVGYKNCKILSPDEVVAIDPFLKDFCQLHSDQDENGQRIWNSDSTAIWRPGGCIDTQVFLPKFYAYLKKTMGQYVDKDGKTQDCFQLKFDSEVVSVNLDSSSLNPHIRGLKLVNGEEITENEISAEYIFCPGEAVGTLARLGFQEPAYAAFAGPSLFITIPLTKELMEKYGSFGHYMEVHCEGIVLSWQARFKDNTVFIGVGGTKAFYGDKQPNKSEAFAKNRNLVQLNIINNVLPEFISLACGYPTSGKKLEESDLAHLEKKGIAVRWVGRRAVAYDGFPTIGPLFVNDLKVANARCTTHLGSGGVSFGPGAVFVSRQSKKDVSDPFIQKVLSYSDSKRKSG